MADPSKQLPAVIGPIEPSPVSRAILDFVSQIPTSQIGASKDPRAQARQLAQRAAQRAALTAGSLALPPGPLGWLTILPELVAIWRIQAQMVSDIAAAFGQQATLGREQMLWCLFRHTAAQAFRDLVVRMGDRLLFRRMSYTVAERVAKQIGVKITQRTISKGASRWLPVVGAVGVGAYAYYDTAQVAATAIELFSSDIEAETDEGTTARVVHPGSESATAATDAAPQTSVQAARGTLGKAIAGAVQTAAKAADKLDRRKTSAPKPRRDDD